MKRTSLLDKKIEVIQTNRRNNQLPLPIAYQLKVGQQVVYMDKLYTITLISKTTAGRPVFNLDHKMWINYREIELPVDWKP